MMAISDCLAARLSDGNSKVLVLALEVRGHGWLGGLAGQRDVLLLLLCMCC
jgi:hypothetical protein